MLRVCYDTVIHSGLTRKDLKPAAALYTKPVSSSASRRQSRRMRSVVPTTRPYVQHWKNPATCVAERRVFDRVRRGEARGCSISFHHGLCRYIGTTVEHTRVDLREISVMTDGHRPAWFGTWVRAV